MSNTAQRSTIAYTVGSGPTFPPNPTTGTPSVSDFTNTVFQLGGVFTKTVVVSFNAFSSGSFQTATSAIYSITTFPNPIKVSGQMTGYVLCGATLAAIPTGILIGMPLVRTFFNQGPGSVLPGDATGSVFTLQPSITYSGPTITVTLTAYSPGSAKAQSVQVNLWALLAGQPA